MWQKVVAIVLLVLGLCSGFFIGRSVGYSAGVADERIQRQLEVERIRNAYIAIVRERAEETDRRIGELRERMVSVYDRMGRILSDAGSLGDRIGRITVILAELGRLIRE